MSSVPNLNIADLLAKLQGQYDSANSASLGRYNSLLGTVDQTAGAVNGLYGQAGAALKGQGATAKNRIQQGLTRGLASSEQDLISRGLGNSTVRSSVRRGITADANTAMNDVDERVAGQRAGLLTQQAGTTMALGGMKGDALLSRQDLGPDAELYAHLIQTLAANGGLGGVHAGAPAKSYNFVGPSASQLGAPNSFVSKANAEWGNFQGGGAPSMGQPQGPAVHTVQGGSSGFPQYQTLNPNGSGGGVQSFGGGSGGFSNEPMQSYALDMSGTKFMNAGSNYQPSGFGVQTFGRYS